MRRVRGVARAHQLLGRFRLALTAQDRTATHLDRFAFTAGTRHACTSFSSLLEGPRLAFFPQGRTGQGARPPSSPYLPRFWRVRVRFPDLAAEGCDAFGEAR